jgi:hypothetical protein
MGLLYFAAVGGSVGAVYFSGKMFDISRSYSPVFGTFFGIALATIAAAFLLRSARSDQAATVLPRKSLNTVGSGSPR